MTPVKRKKIYDHRATEMQRTPKGKFSKSKAIHKLSKNKVIIDFAVDKNFFQNEFNLKEEEAKKISCFDEANNENYNYLQTPKGPWYQDSPFKTVQKTRVNSSIFNEFSSVAKQPKKNNRLMESPFCKLLNDSDKCSIDTYQLLSEGNQLDDDYEVLRDKVENLLY